MPDLLSLAADLLDDVRRDVRYAVRTTLTTPAFAVAVASLALAVGATTAVHGTADWLLNRSPGGVLEPERVLALDMTARDRPDVPGWGVSWRQYEELRTVQDAFVDLAGYAKVVGVLSTDVAADQIIFEFVTGSYFPLLGVRAAVGRTIAPEDDVEGAMPVAVLSHDFWRSRFGGDPDIVGEPIRLNGQASRVIGVMPEAFEGYSLDWNGPSGVWVPMRAASRLGVGGFLNIPFLQPLGRLRPEVVPALLPERMQAWVPQVASVGEGTLRMTGIQAVPGGEMRIARREEARAFLGSLLVVCAVILLAACFSLTNLLLGRAVSRRRELALRAALGAGRGRLFRQLLTESALVGLAATALGLGVGVGVARALSSWSNVYLSLPTTPAPLTTFGAIDSRMVATALVLGLASTLVAGLLPALLASFRDPMASLGGLKPAWTWSGVRVTPRQVVLVLQIGVSVALGVTAGLYARSFARVASVDSGYREPAAVLMAKVLPRGSSEDRSEFFRTLLERLHDMPGVESATIGANPPFRIGTSTVSLPGSPDLAVRVGSSSAGPRFFEVQGIPLVHGQEFHALGDHPSGLVVNRVLAERLWPGEDATGRPVIHGGVERSVLGVTADDRCADLLGAPGPCAWTPLRTTGSTSGYLRVRTRGAPMAFVPALRGLVGELDPDVAVAEAMSLEAFLRDLVGAQRGSALASSALALLAIVLLAVGCASLYLSMVEDSQREIAIRMALGANHATLIRRLLSHGLLLTTAGIALGLGGATLLARRIAHQLHRTEPGDPLVLGAVSLLVALVGLAAVGHAARAATRTEPVRHLRRE